MTSIGLIVRVTARDGHGAALREVLERVVGLERDNAGTLVCALHADVANDHIFYTQYVFADETAVTAHRSTPGVAEGQAEASAIADFEIFRVTPLAAKGLSC